MLRVYDDSLIRNWDPIFWSNLCWHYLVLWNGFDIPFQRWKFKIPPRIIQILIQIQKNPEIPEFSIPQVKSFQPLSARLSATSFTRTTEIAENDLCLINWHKFPTFYVNYIFSFWLCRKNKQAVSTISVIAIIRSRLRLKQTILN